MFLPKKPTLTVAGSIEMGGGACALRLVEAPRPPTMQSPANARARRANDFVMCESPLHGHCGQCPLHSPTPASRMRSMRLFFALPLPPLALAAAGAAQARLREAAGSEARLSFP